MPKSPLAVAAPFAHFQRRRSLSGVVPFLMVRSAPLACTGALQPARGALPQRPVPGVGCGVGPVGATVGVAVAPGGGVGVGPTTVGVAVGSSTGCTTIATPPGTSASLVPSFTWNV